MVQSHTPRHKKVLGSDNRFDDVKIHILDRFGVFQRELIPVGGAIPQDGEAEQRSTFDLEVVDPKNELVPHSLRDHLAPGWHVIVYRGSKIELIMVYEEYYSTPESWLTGTLQSMVVEPDGLTLGD